MAAGKRLKTETIKLSTKQIKNCVHCNFCLARQKAGKYCSLEDDAQPLFEHGGMETTHLSHLYAFITLDMIPATIHSSISPLGASGLSSAHGEGKFDRSIRIGINDDTAGLEAAKAHLARAMELVELISR
jgi:hypothetical protein